jgi:hypothetical protein
MNLCNCSDPLYVPPHFYYTELNSQRVFTIPSHALAIRVHHGDGLGYLGKGGTAAHGSKKVASLVDGDAVRSCPVFRG